MPEPIKLSVKPLSSSERKKRRIDGLAVSLDDNDPKFLPAHNAHSVLVNASVLIDSRSTESKTEIEEKEPDRGTVVLRSADHSTTVGQGEAAPLHNDQTVVPSSRGDPYPLSPRNDSVTKASRTDLSSVVTDQESIPLSEIQWVVWQELQRLSHTNQRTCFQDLAKATNQKKRGIQRAVEALRKEGAIRLLYIRSKEFQGFSVEINPAIRFHLGSKKEVYGLIKRGQTVIPRHYGLTVVPGYSEHNMHVCKRNTYILGNDLRVLLEQSPPEWKIREQTLIQIADAFPTMTSLEFRLSLRRLVDQAKNGKQAIQNPNAWLKASFERNGGPLVTEREIEVRVRQQEEMNTPAPPPVRPALPQPETQDVDSIRRYISARPEDRAAIDRLAEERIERLLANISSDKHAGIREEARLECTREYFGVKAKTTQS